MRRLIPCLLPVLALTACNAGGPDPALVEGITEGTAAAGTILVAPRIDGAAPRSFLFHARDNSLTLDYGQGFRPTLTLRAARSGDLCAHREPDWDRCEKVDEDAVRLSFEEMDAVVVRRDGTELFWNNLSFELPDEDYASHDDLVAAVNAKVDTYVDASRHAERLSVDDFLAQVPKGKIEVS